MNMDEERYLVSDMHYDIEEAESLDDLRRLFRKLVDAIRYDGLRAYKVYTPGKYGRKGGKFVFDGVLKGFSYELIIKLNNKDDV